MPGSRPSSSSRSASFPRPTAVPIVSKKSDSMTDKIAAIAVQKLSTLKTSKLKLPTSAKSGTRDDLGRELGDAGSDCIPDVLAAPADVDERSPTNVPKAMPIRIAPRTLRATSAAVRASVMRNTRIRKRREIGGDRDRRATAGDDDAAVHEPDDRQEHADPDPDRELQVHRDRVHDHLAQAREHQDRDQEPFDHDHAHRRGPRQPELSDEREGDERVQSESGRDRERVLARDPHRERHHPGGERRHGEHLRERQAGARCCRGSRPGSPGSRTGCRPSSARS